MGPNLDRLAATDPVYRSVRPSHRFQSLPRRTTDRLSAAARQVSRRQAASAAMPRKAFSKASGGCPPEIR
jgi:hypothetical protein